MVVLEDLHELLPVEASHSPLIKCETIKREYQSKISLKHIDSTHYLTVLVNTNIDKEQKQLFIIFLAQALRIDIVVHEVL